MSDFDVILLYSGGVDSTVLLHSLIKKQNVRVMALSFKYGQRNNIENWCAKLQASNLKCGFKLVDLTTAFDEFKSALCGTKEAMPETVEVLGDAQPIVYVPYRNMIFLAYALGFAESTNVPKIYYGAQLNDNYQFFDTTPQFVSYINLIASLNRKFSTVIEAPFATKPKKEIIKEGLELGIDFANIISCYNPSINGYGIKSCGICPSCTQRLKAFKELNVSDPTKYKK